MDENEMFYGAYIGLKDTNGVELRCGDRVTILEEYIEELCDKVLIVMQILREAELPLQINNLSYEEAISFTRLCNEVISLANKISGCGKSEFYYPAWFPS